MASSFFGINVGMQGLFTAQTNLSVTSHNISNAETVGFSRQYAIQSATRPLSNSDEGMIGTGSEVTNIEQYREAYLDYKYWSMTNELGEYDTKNELLSQMELIFNEPSDSGYSTYFTDIFDSLQTLSKNPGDSTSRSALVDSMDSFASYLNDIGDQLITLQREANFGIKNSVDQINFYAQQLATLNNQIGNLELTGKSANDLRDERNRLIDQLSTIINVETKEVEDVNGKKTFRVSINGQMLVDGTSANYLETRVRDTLDNPEDSVDLYDVYWTNGKELYLNNSNLSGELKGYIDIRDGNNGENFTATIDSINANGTMVVSSPDRTDIPQEGELYVGGTLIRYHSYTYDETLDEMTFDYGFPNTVNGATTTATDVYGNPFTETVTWDSETQIRINNPSDQTLLSSGEITINGETYTYTDYAKDAGTGEITLQLNVPAATETHIGDDMSFKGVPYYMSQLNEFVRTIAQEFNTINESGNGGTGTQMFTYEGYTGTPALTVGSDFSYEAITVLNFSVNEAMLDDSGLIETSAAADAGESANDLILDLIEKRHDTGMFEKGEPDNFMQAVIGELGIDAKQVESFKSGQETLLNLVQNQRLSVSGVDLNEETTNLVKFQQAYDVAAQIISVMNEIYNVTINQMGV